MKGYGLAVFNFGLGLVQIPCWLVGEYPWKLINALALVIAWATAVDIGLSVRRRKAAHAEMTRMLKEVGW